ncbi:hypothetical protein HZI73_04085 [Vallitalea pronyensis]|uniref:DHHW protein n=1 Tax=Vallitalea pronyensis TaxID=1348613 RepID=A0A8J8MH70_9FIRM|nr:DHHW family protein [Vallitalea pronyensis]QUI21519.1 hypothetical protein HZI73_04085 [Vallitalea pronyensis]
MKQAISNWIVSIMFITIIFSLSLATLLSDKKLFSEEENRFLKPLPQLTYDQFVHNNLTRAYDTYLNDHFIHRYQWVRLKVTTDYLMGRKEHNGIYLSTKYLVENVKDKGKYYSDDNIHQMIQFSKNVPESSAVYFMLIPSASAIQSYKVPPNAHTFNQWAFIQQTYGQTEPYMNNIGIYDDLLSYKHDYIYYQTDHHWTMDGAYIAYKRMAQVMDFTPVPYEDLDVKTVSKDFKGSLHTKSGFDHVQSDVMKAIDHDNIDEFIVYNGENKQTHEGIYFEAYLTKKDKYTYFLGINQPKVTIKTKTPSDRQLLIFKDSYAHCLVPFLTYTYDKITLIDMRYVNSDILSDLQLSDYNDILFMYSIDVILNTKNTSKLTYMYKSAKMGDE